MFKQQLNKRKVSRFGSNYFNDGSRKKCFLVVRVQQMLKTAKYQRMQVLISDSYGYPTPFLKISFIPLAKCDLDRTDSSDCPSWTVFPPQKIGPMHVHIHARAANHHLRTASPFKIFKSCENDLRAAESSNRDNALFHATCKKTKPDPLCSRSKTRL